MHFLFVILMITSSAKAERIVCRSLATGNPLVAPQTIVKCTGVRFADGPVQAGFPNDTEPELGGVWMEVGGQRVGLRYVTLNYLIAVLPDFDPGSSWITGATISISGKPHPTWLQTASVAPGMFSNFGERPQAIAYQKEGQAVFLPEYGSIPTGARVQLVCTGVRRAASVSVLLDGEGAPAVSEPFPGIAGQDYVIFDLPSNLRGYVLIQVIADDRKSNQLSLLIE